MEKPTSTAIDYDSQQNIIHEDMVREHYSQVKALIERIIAERLRDNRSNGLCIEFIKEDRNLWEQVIKPWFTPQRFNLTDVYFNYCNPDILILGYEITIKGKTWYKVPLEKLRGYEYFLKTAFWFPTSKEYNANRIKILECALRDLERLKEGEPKLPPLTFEEPKIYP